MLRFSFFKSTVFLLVLGCFSCGSGNGKKDTLKSEGAVIHDTMELSQDDSKNETQLDTVKKFGRPVSGISTTHVFTGANQWKKYMSLLKDKKVGVVANQTSIVNDTLEYPDEVRVVDMHLIDFLTDFEVYVYKTFAPEHGFRGTADAGETVKDGIDTKTGISITSLHGKNKKPTQEQLEGIDIMVFDIQDVGVRFYTYIATMHYVMEACAEKGIPLVILDRPNPNGHYIDGPTMEKAHTSFLGLHPIPLVHGMTIGEYAQMINGEGWLQDRRKCDLKIITMENYTHETFYSVPVRPSPNLPNDTAINLYPSLGLLEGTTLNAGRGTEMQFQLLGDPLLPKEKYTFSYTPQENFGAKHPKHKGVQCSGLDLRNTPRMNRVDLTWIMDAYRNHPKKEVFFNTSNFTAHAGTETLQKQIEQGFTFREIRATWLKDLEAYDEMRQPYLLYR